MPKPGCKFFLLLLFSCLWPGPLRAVAPPAPGVALPQGFAGFAADRNRTYRAVRRITGQGPGEALLARSAPAKLSLPVLLASYADRPGRVSSSEFEKRIFGTTATGSVRQYYEEVSRGAFTLAGVVYGWVGTPRAQADYNRSGPLGVGAVFPYSPEGFVVDAVAAADNLVDFGLFDNDGPDGVPNSGDDDGFVDALIVVHPGGDAAAGDANNLWSVTGLLGNRAVQTGDSCAKGGFIKVSLYSILPELAWNGSSNLPADIGVFCHELGHQLGLVDLYATSGSTAVTDPGALVGIGIWGLMGHGSYGADGVSPQKPTHLCAWSKLRLGWVRIVHENGLGEQSLAPVNASGEVVRLWDNEQRDFSYFLLSYRTRQGFDAALPAEGLLVWHVDERMPDNQDLQHKLVDLEEADGRADMDRGVNRGDSGDPFPGSAARQLFGPATNPSSARYDGTSSGVSITGIRLSGGLARFSLDQPVRAGFTLAYDEDQPNAVGYGYGGNVAYGAVVFRVPASGALTQVRTFFLYDDMDYFLELYTGQDSGLMHCRACFRQGHAPGPGWQTLEVGNPVWFDQGDSVVVAVGYFSKGFNEGWPVPYDATGRSDGASLVDNDGLGRFKFFQYDLSIRAVISTALPRDSALALTPGLELGTAALDFGRCYAGQRYELRLPIINPGLRYTALKGIELTGGQFSLGPFELLIPCSTRLDLPVYLDAAVLGNAEGSVFVSPASSGLDGISALLEARVEGWSISYDSTSADFGYSAFTDRANGAVTFSMPGHGLLSGVRVYVLQDSLRLRLRIWSEVRGGFPRCLVAETAGDTLVFGPGWRQVFLPRPVDIDSGDTFTADVEFTGQPYSMLVPVDTLLASSAPGYYNIRYWESWLESDHPVRIRALVLPPGSFEQEAVLKRSAASVNRQSLAFGPVAVGVGTQGAFWLINRGTSVLKAAASIENQPQQSPFSLQQNQWQVPCLDSVLISVSYQPSSPGLDSAYLSIQTSDPVRPGIGISLRALADRFELAHDENGHTGAGGFGDSLAWGAVVFNSPWSGVLNSLKVYFNYNVMSVAATVYRTVAGPGLWSDPAGSLARTVSGRGWAELALPGPVGFAAGDSFAVVMQFASAGGEEKYPLSLDTWGQASGKSWASRLADGPWENLSYDLNIRAVLKVGNLAYFPVSGTVADDQGLPVKSVSLALSGDGRSYSALSDSQGLFSFQAVEPGAYTLVPSRLGYSFVPDLESLTVLGPVEGISFTARRSTRGDLNNSGKTDIFDLLYLVRVLGGKAPSSPQTDLTGDGKTDIFDLLELLRLLPR